MKINSYSTTYKTNVDAAKEDKTTKKTTEETKGVKTESKAVKSDSVEISSKGKALSQQAIETIQQKQSASFNNMLSGMLGMQVDSAKNIDMAQIILDKSGMGNVSPADAAYNVSEEGIYGVNSVATNIMDMAISLSGGDPEKMEMLKDAVTKGFKAAGMELGVGEKISKLPQVSQDTYTEIMKRFDHFEANGSLDSYKYTPYDKESEIKGNDEK